MRRSQTRQASHTVKIFRGGIEFGIFFDSAERHGRQHCVGARVDEKTWFANILRNFGGDGGAVDYGRLRRNADVARRRQRISFVAWNYDFGFVGSAHGRK